MGYRFSARTGRLKEAAKQTADIHQRMMGIKTECSFVSMSIRRMTGMEDVCRAIGRIGEELGNEIRTLQNLSICIDKSGTLYGSCENDISENGEHSTQKFPLHKLSSWSKESRGISEGWMNLFR